MLSFSLSSSEEFAGDAIELVKGDELSAAMSKLLVGGKNIIVRNNVIIAPGNYEVIMTKSHFS